MRPPADWKRFIPPDRYLMIASGKLHLSQPDRPRGARMAIDCAAIRQLEQELATVKDDLQTTIEQLEASNEEYKAAHEEVVSTNEELQSTNEELETSKEELQSLNEELSTVNSQLASKVEELETKHADLENLIAVTEVPTVCLDTSMAVRWFTPSAQQVIRLKPTDRGRPLADLAHDFVRDDLVEMAQRVFHELAPIDDEVATSDGRTFLRRVSLYRGDEHQIGGIVITFVDITRRKRDEHALRESELRLADELTVMTRLHELVGRLLVCEDLSTALEEVLTASTAMMGADRGNVQIFNPSTQALEIVAQRGFEREFLDHFRSVTINDDSICRMALQSRKRVVVEDVQAADLSDSFKTIAARAGYRAVLSTPLMSRSGKILGMLSTHYRQPHRPSDRDLRALDLYVRQAADFIERKHAEDALHRLNQELEGRVSAQTQDVRQLATLVESANDAMYIRSLDGRILTWNRGAEVLYGYRSKEAIGKSYSMLVPADNSDGLDSKHQQLLRGESIAPFETWRIRKDGRRVFVSISNSPLKDGGGQVTAIASVGRDITEQRRAQSALRDSGERLQAILGSTVDAIITIDHNSMITSVNRATERMFGYRQTELIGQNVKIIIPPPDHDAHDGYVARYLRTGESRILGTAREVMHRRKDGSTFFGELTVTHLPELKMFTGVVHDVSERKSAEARDRQHQAELAHVLRVATARELASGLAHELNQPLAAISNNIQACVSRIRRAKTEGGILLRPLEQAAEEALRAGAIVHSMRELVEKRPPRYESIDLREALGRAIMLLGPQLAHHRIEVHSEGAERPIPLHADKIQIEQVLINLVQNAIESIDQGGGSRRNIRVAVSSPERGIVEVTIQDSGPGVSKSDEEKLFTPFFSTKRHGLGIGLALSRSIIEAHGGRLWFDPSRDRRRGAIFRLTLPLASGKRARNRKKTSR